MLGGMHSRARASGPVPSAASLAKWLRPFVGALVISSALAVATTMALHAVPDSRTGRTAEPAPHWVEVWEFEAGDTRGTYECLARPGITDTDVVSIDADGPGLHDFREQVCIDVRPSKLH